MNFIPNVSPKTFTLSAVVVGFLLLDHATSNEQNAMGNWLMLVAQVLCTNAFFRQVQMERGNISNDNGNNYDYSKDDTINMLKKMIDALQKEVDDLKNNIQ